MNKFVTTHLEQQHQATPEKVIIIIPTYNEAAVIEETITQVFDSVASQKNYDIHILVFDSASRDNTQYLVKNLQKKYPNLHLHGEPQKSGLGSAYLQAINYALSTLDADIVFEFDADLSHQPKYINGMLERIKKCDCVVGSRYIKGGSIPANWAFHRKLFSVFGNYITRLVLTPKYKDFTSGFRATRRHILQKILPKKFLSNHYAYKVQLLWLLHKNHARISEYPIDFIDREKGVSKLPKNCISDTLKVIFTLRYYELKQFFSMCLVGSMGMLVQFFVYNLLRDYLTPYNASQIAVITAIINNFILNNRFTFRSKSLVGRAFKMKKLAGFILYSLVMIYVQSFWVKLGVNYLGSGALQENILLATGIGLGSLLNYFTYTRHIWTERITHHNQLKH
ncbi:glycosyltransferase [Legionella worsleiensis]|uniref:glycosyltransferase n=1 Tax=Legionella worsleiensis TaxID=45076 RepID=UPI0007318299|nr:glycosyltransferase family 2 protein [Legionella worsleiensis]